MAEPLNVLRKPINLAEKRLSRLRIFAQERALLDKEKNNSGLLPVSPEKKQIRSLRRSKR